MGNQREHDTPSDGDNSTDDRAAGWTIALKPKRDRNRNKRSRRRYGKNNPAWRRRKGTLVAAHAGDGPGEPIGESPQQWATNAGPTPATGPASPLARVHNNGPRTPGEAEGGRRGSRRRSRRIQNQQSVNTSPAKSRSYAAVSPKVTFETDSPAAAATMTALRLRRAAPRPWPQAPTNP